MNTDNPDELQEAYEWLVKMKQTIHPSFVTDEMIDGMAQGEKWIAMMYSGDAAYASMENEKLAVWAPEQGTNIAIDCMFIPSNASNPEMANQFINYVLDYDNSMMITGNLLHHSQRESAGGCHRPRRRVRRCGRLSAPLRL